MSNIDRTAVSGNVRYLGGVAVVLFLIAAIIAVVIAVPEGANKGSLITILIAAIPSTLAALAALAAVDRVGRRIEQVGQRVEETAADVAAVRNGEMEGKLHRVLEERGVERRP